MVLAVEKPSFLVYQLLEPYFRQLFRVVKVSKLYRETFLIFIFSSKSGRNYPVVRYLQNSDHCIKWTSCSLHHALRSIPKKPTELSKSSIFAMENHCVSVSCKNNSIDLIKLSQGSQRTQRIETQFLLNGHEIQQIQTLAFIHLSELHLSQRLAI